MTQDRICQCGCGEPIPPGRRPDARYIDDAHKDRAYHRRKGSKPRAPRSSPKRKRPKPKPKPAALPKRPKPAVSGPAQIRQRQRHEQLKAGLERRVSGITRDFRGGGGRRQ